jgi:tetratricopeptide (TPR) repeat protein
MKTSSVISLALALVLGMPSIAVSTDAYAQDKKEKKSKKGKGEAPKAAPAKISPAFQKAAEPVQKMIAAKDFNGAKAGLATAEPLATMPDEKFFAGSFKLQIGQGMNDYAMMRKGINEMIAAGSTQASDPAALYMNAGRLAYQANDYVDAIAKHKEALRLGNKSVDAYLQTAESNYKLKNFAEAETYLASAIDAEKAAGSAVPESWYVRGLAIAYQMKNIGSINKAGRKLVSAYPTSKNWRETLVTYRDYGKIDNQLLLDIYRLMRATKSIAGERDFNDYAAITIERALPGEAKSVIEEGFATNAIPKTSTVLRERLSEANAKIASDRASVTADEKRAVSAADGRLAANTASALIGYSEYAKAAELFKMAIAKGGVDLDTVNTRLGIAYVLSGNKVEAKTALEAVNKASPRGDIAQYWLLWLSLNP